MKTTTTRHNCWPSYWNPSTNFVFKSMLIGLVPMIFLSVLRKHWEPFRAVFLKEIPNVLALAPSTRNSSSSYSTRVKCPPPGTNKVQTQVTDGTVPLSHALCGICLVSPWVIELPWPAQLPRRPAPADWCHSMLHRLFIGVFDIIALLSICGNSYLWQFVLQMQSSQITSLPNASRIVLFNRPSMRALFRFDTH